ncbi:hypothetical protein Hanom_Chr01g00077431 [Helianthus anomalus]
MAVKQARGIEQWVHMMSNQWLITILVRIRSVQVVNLVIIVCPAIVFCWVCGTLFCFLVPFAKLFV